MAIKQKTGGCKDCPKGSGPVPLIAGRCQFHYWQYRSKVNASKPKNKAKEVQKQVFGTFFASQMLTMPKYCEESGKLLPTSPAWLKKACVAHILPKRADHGFPSVAIHPLNRIFLHPDIHTNMDNSGFEYMKNMKALPIIKERIKAFYHLLTEKEKNKVPDFLLED